MVPLCRFHVDLLRAEEMIRFAEMQKATPAPRAAWVRPRGATRGEFFLSSGGGEVHSGGRLVEGRDDDMMPINI